MIDFREATTEIVYALLAALSQSPSDCMFGSVATSKLPAIELTQGAPVLFGNHHRLSLFFIQPIDPFEDVFHAFVTGAPPNI